MSKDGTLMTAGILVLITPFLGLPISWLSWLLPILGAVVIVIAQLIRRERTAPPALRSEAPATPLEFEPPSHDAPSPIA